MRATGYSYNSPFAFVHSILQLGHTSPENNNTAPPHNIDNDIDNTGQDARTEQKGFATRKGGGGKGEV